MSLHGELVALAQGASQPSLSFDGRGVELFTFKNKEFSEVSKIMPPLDTPVNYDIWLYFIKGKKS